MNRSLLSVKFLFLCTLTAISVLFCGCRQTLPESKTSYDAVTGKLDPHGSFYMYADTQQLMDKLAKQQKVTTQLVKSIFKDKQTQDQAEQITNMAMNAFINSGLLQMDGIGASSIKFNQELYRCKFVFHKKPETQPEKLAWKVFGRSPHELKSLEMLPANTAFASFFDFNTVMAGKFISQEFRNSKIENVLVTKNKAAVAFAKATGISPLALCEKLGDHFGIFFTLSKDKTFMLPIDGKFEKFPEIALNIVISVKDSTLFDLLLKKSPKKLNPQEKTENGIHMVVLNQIPLMLKFQPAFGQKDGLLVISSQPEVIKDFFNPDAKTKLIASAEFKKLAENIPTLGNGYKYVSPEICKMMFKMQKFFIAVQKMSMTHDMPGPSPEYNAQVAQLYGNLKNFSIYQCNPDGIYVEANSNFNLPGILTLNAILAPFIYSAVILQPTLQKAKQASKGVKCINNLKQLGVALMMYINDNDGRFPDPGIAGLNRIYKEGYIQSPQVFVCQSSKNIPAVKGHSLTPRNVSYIYLGSYAPITKIKYPSSTPIMFDKPGNHNNYINVLFVDGHVQRIKGNFKTCSDIIWKLSRNLPEDVRNRLLEMAESFDKDSKQNH